MPNEIDVEGVTLERPIDWAGMTAWQKAFFDVPVVGLRSRTFRGFRRRVSSRTGDLARFWANYSTKEFDTMRRISDIVTYEIGWPQGFFLPGDSFEALIWDGGDGLATTTALERIEMEFGMAKKQDAEWREWMTKVFGTVVQMISNENDIRKVKSIH